MTGTHAARTAGRVVLNIALPASSVVAGAAYASAHGWLQSSATDQALTAAVYAKSQDLNEYRASQAYLHTRDSLIYDAQLNQIRVDLRSLIHDCQKRGGCQ